MRAARLMLPLALVLCGGAAGGVERYRSALDATLRLQPLRPASRATFRPLETHLSSDPQPDLSWGAPPPPAWLASWNFNWTAAVAPRRHPAFPWDALAAASPFTEVAVTWQHGVWDAARWGGAPPAHTSTGGGLVIAAVLSGQLGDDEADGASGWEPVSSRALPSSAAAAWERLLISLRGWLLRGGGGALGLGVSLGALHPDAAPGGQPLAQGWYTQAWVHRSTGSVRFQTRVGHSSHSRPCGDTLRRLLGLASPCSGHGASGLASTLHVTSLLAAPYSRYSVVMKTNGSGDHASAAAVAVSLEGVLTARLPPAWVAAWHAVNSEQGRGRGSGLAVPALGLLLPHQYPLELWVSRTASAAAAGSSSNRAEQAGKATMAAAAAAAAAGGGDAAEFAGSVADAGSAASSSSGSESLLLAGLALAAAPGAASVALDAEAALQVSMPACDVAGIDVTERVVIASGGDADGDDDTQPLDALPRLGLVAGAALPPAPQPPCVVVEPLMLRDATELGRGTLVTRLTLSCMPRPASTDPSSGGVATGIALLRGEAATPWFLDRSHPSLHAVAEGSSGVSVEAGPVEAVEVVPPQVRADAAVSRWAALLRLTWQRQGLNTTAVHTLERLPAPVTITLSSSFSASPSAGLLHAEETAPDAHRGLDLLPDAFAVSVAASDEGSSSAPSVLLLWEGVPPGPPPVIELPSPDFSMPYNVMALVTTALAFFLGGAVNALLRKKATGKGGEKKEKSK